ncbi:MAG: hypothetical protein ACQCN3_02565 [Candidatus Bathyarchaeia archaeon]
MSALPDIQFNNPFKECCSWTGQRQTGKTRGMANFIVANPNPMEIFDTLGVLGGMNLPLPKNVRIYKPSWVGKPLPDYDGRLPEFCSWCTKLWQRTHVIGVIEEWHLFNKTKFGLPAEFANLMNQGGNYNIALWGNSQRPAQCHNDILSGCKHHFIYNLGLPQDLRWMEKFIPDKKLISGDPKDPDSLCIANLPPYHFLYYNMQTRQHDFYKPLKAY